MIPQSAQPPDPEQKNLITRRAVFFKVGLLLNGLAALVLATPIIGYLISPILAAKEKGGYKRWITLGELDEFPENQTRLAKFKNPITGVSDGKTDDIPCWVRRLSGEQFQVFAINCAHLGCPVRWFPQSGLFMCPCHGGVYYQDGARASGPPERGLFEYSYKVVDGKLLIEAGQLPTLSTTAALRKGSGGCQG